MNHKLFLSFYRRLVHKAITIYKLLFWHERQSGRKKFHKGLRDWDSSGVNIPSEKITSWASILRGTSLDWVITIAFFVILSEHDALCVFVVPTTLTWCDYDSLLISSSPLSLVMFPHAAAKNMKNVSAFKFISLLVLDVCIIIHSILMNVAMWT